MSILPVMLFCSADCLLIGLQEEQRLRREAKRRWAMQCFYFARWRAEARRWAPCHANLSLTVSAPSVWQALAVATQNCMTHDNFLGIAHRRIEERVRQERLAANLKACRVGGTATRKVCGWFVGLKYLLPVANLCGCPCSSAFSAVFFFILCDELQAVALAVAGTASMDALADWSSGSQWQANGLPPSTAALLPPTPAAKPAIDLAALAAPLLLQRSLSARSLYWKVLLAPPPVLHASSRLWGPEQQRLQHLHSWLALQLQRGRLLQVASGSAYVEGPLALRVGAADAAEVVAELATCLAVPDSSTQHCGSTALAGASGIILALPTSRAGHREVQQRLPLPSSMAARLPVLLVAATDAAAQYWQEEIAASRLAFTGPVRVISVEEHAQGPSWPSAAARAGSRGGEPVAEPAAYNRPRLMEGLRWLAAHSPPQPVLKVGRVGLSAAAG